MSKIDIISQEWNDLIFEGRNKEYGGYFLRRTSDKRHILALIIVVAVALVAFYSPKLFNILLAGNNTIEIVSTTVEITDFDTPTEEIEEIEEIPEVKQLQELRQTIQFTEFVAVDREVAVISVAEVFEQDTAAVSTVTQAGSSDIDIPVEIQVKGPEVDSTFLPYQVDQQPAPPYDWQKYLQKNLRYPSIMQEMGIQGKVNLQFVVSKTGKVTNVKVVKGLDPAGDKEAIRVVESMPDWIPGKRNGEPVQTLFSLPIVYRLQ